MLEGRAGQPSGWSISRAMKKGSSTIWWVKYEDALLLTGLEAPGGCDEPYLTRPPSLKENLITQFQSNYEPPDDSGPTA